MFCPNCNEFCNDNSRFCNHCGVPLQHSSTERKGSHRVPILILVILSVLGTGLFFATSGLGGGRSGGSCFQMRGGVLTFDERYYDGSGDVTVPEQVDGQPVTEIGASCFADCADITTVVLPKTIEAIDSYAFKNCTSLRGIKLPDSVVFIGTGAFSGCTDLEAISIPLSAAYIAPDAFESCSALKHVFYAGTYSQWQLLYGPYMDGNVNIYCSDGNYCQGIPIP